MGIWVEKPLPICQYVSSPSQLEGEEVPRYVIPMLVYALYSLLSLST